MKYYWKKKKIIQLKLRDRLQFEENNYFFVCKNCNDQNIKYKFDEGFDLNFRCPECSGPLEAQDNQKIIQFLKEKIVLNGKTNLINELE